VNKRGFSLLELLVVIAIIGVLATIVIANVGNAMQRSRQKQTMADLRTLGLGVESAFNTCGAYPVDPSGVAATTCDPPTPTNVALGFAKARILTTVPVCDGWGRPFRWTDAGDTSTVDPGEAECKTLFTAAATWRANAYSLHSTGSDGVSDCGPAVYDVANGLYRPANATCQGVPCGAFRHFVCDPVFAGGAFIAKPKGFQK